MSLFCRHNRLEANCPICSREKAAARPAPSGRGGPGARRTSSAASPPARRHGSGSRAGRLVTRRLARATEDGYANPLVPGVRATADAERLARAIAVAAARLDPPGPHPAVAQEPDPEDATWLAFLLALAGPDRAEMQEAILEARPRFADADADAGSGLGADAERTVGAYRAWAARHGSQTDALAGEPSWSPSRRFARTFDRLALPGFGRAARFEFLTILGAAGVQPLEADGLHVAVAHDDATTLAAKRALSSGDALLLERRAADLAGAAGVPIGALDRALAVWDRPGVPLDAPEDDRLGRIRAALRLG